MILLFSGLIFIKHSKISELKKNILYIFNLNSEKIKAR